MPNNYVEVIELRKKDKNKLLLEFNKYINDENKHNRYNHIQELYLKAREHYNKKIKDKDFDIKIEKIKIEKKLGNYSGIMSKSNEAIFVGIFSGVFPLFIERIGLFDEGGNMIRTMLYFFYVLILVAFTFGPTIKKDSTKDAMLYICLNVLNEIEKEIIDEKLKLREEADKKVTTLSQATFEQPFDKRTVLKEIVAPAIMEVAATIIKKDSWFKRVFKK